MLNNIALKEIILTRSNRHQTIAWIVLHKVTEITTMKMIYIIQGSEINHNQDNQMKYLNILICPKIIIKIYNANPL